MSGKMSALKEKSLDIMFALKKKRKQAGGGKQRTSTSFCSSSVNTSTGTRVDLTIDEEIALMLKAETEQTSDDRFWGLDKQQQNINLERNLMFSEEERSIALENYCKRIDIVAVWEENDRQSRYEDAYAIAIEEAYERKLYLDSFNSVSSSVQVMNYQWPTKPHVYPIDDQPNTNQSVDKFVIEDISGMKSTIHYEGLQKTRILAQSMSYKKEKNVAHSHHDVGKVNKSPQSVHSRHTSNETPQNGVFMKDEKYSLIPLISRAQSPVMQGAINASPGMFERPASPLSLLVPETEASKKKIFIPGASKASTESAPANNGDTMAAVALFQNKHLKQLGNKYALEESGPGVVDSSNSDPVSTHIESYHGHSIHKWDQRVLIKHIFHIVDNTNMHGAYSHKKGTITLKQFMDCVALVTAHNGSFCNCCEPVIENGASRSTARSKLKSRMNMMPVGPVSCSDNCLSNLLGFLKFTLFGTWLKLKQQHYFELVFDVCGENNGVALTLKELILAARAAANEVQVPPCRIRLPEEHKSTSVHEYSMQLVINSRRKRQTSGGDVNTNGADGKLLTKYYATLAREHRLSNVTKSSGDLQRIVKVGDVVWSLYGSGVTWFPAIVTSKNGIDGTFDISFPLNTDEFHQMGMELSSKEIINNYNKNNQTFVNKSTKKKKEVEVVIIPPKALSDERAYFKYVFHLVDTNGTKSVDSQVLIDTLGTVAYSDIVKSSLALQMLLSDDGDGSYLFVDILTVNPKTSEDEFVELCCTLNETASYQML